MKVFVIGFLLILGAIGIFGYKFLSPQKQPAFVTPEVVQIPATPTMSDTSTQEATKTLFVPYWGLNKNDIDMQNYTDFVYFGIVATEQGIDKTDAGYKSLQQFIDKSDASKKRFLALRMLDPDINSKVLDSKTLQETIISETIATAKQYGFNGIVLDFEYTPLAFDSVVNKITNLTTNFYSLTHENNLSFSLMVYGDTFYRARPYDLAKIAPGADKLLIMAYDFHKARGNPGPNFPLRGKEIYGYDLVTMVDNFLKVVPKEKLTVVFGLFGYDWETDNRNQSTKNGQPLSYLEMKQKFVDACLFKKCVVKRDENAGENQVRYTDDVGKLHVVWFEDWDSVAKKQEYLESKGIKSLGFWAYSYF